MGGNRLRAVAAQVCFRDLLSKILGHNDLAVKCLLGKNDLNICVGKKNVRGFKVKRIQILLIVLVLGVASLAYAESYNQQCNDNLRLLEAGILEPTKYNIERCLGDCGEAIKADSQNTHLVIVYGKIRRLYGLKAGACEDFGVARDMGDSSAFDAYCNADGSPK